MGETIIVFTLLSEIKKIKDIEKNITLPKGYNAQTNEGQLDEKARLCLLEDSANFKFPDAGALEENLYYILHAGSTVDPKTQIERLSQFASSNDKKLFGPITTFSHIPGDPVWDRIAVICSDEPSGDKGVSLSALTELVKQSHFCRSLDEYVALRWLLPNITDNTERNWIEERIGGLSFNERRDLRMISNFTQMRLQAEKLWFEYQGGGAFS